MSIADNTWLLTVEFAASLAFQIVIELVFAALALTVIRWRRPRGGLLLFGAVLVGLVLSTVTSVAYPIAFRLVDTSLGVDNFLWIQLALNGVSSLSSALARLLEISAVVAVAVDPGPVGDADDPLPS